MGRLIVHASLAPNRAAPAPDRPDEDGAGARGGWQMPLMDDVSAGGMFAMARSMDALLLGRRTYEIFARHWPNAPGELPFARLFNRVPKYVASRTLSGPLTWPGSAVLQGDLAGSVTELKQRHDEVQVMGSLDLVQSLLRLGLVDRLNLWQYPLLLGGGGGAGSGRGTVPADLELTDLVTHGTGARQLAYELVGGPRLDTVDA